MYKYRQQPTELFLKFKKAECHVNISFDDVPGKMYALAEAFLAFLPFPKEGAVSEDLTTNIREDNTI